MSSAVLAGGTHTPVVLCCVLVYTPEPTVRRLRVPDGRRRARVAHAPKAANDEARVFAEGGHPPSLVLFCALVLGWGVFRVYRNLNFNDFSLTMDLSIIPSYRTSLCSMFDKHNAKNWAIIIDL